MATNNCSPVTFFCTCENGFYFKDKMAETEVDADSFSMSANCLKYLVRGKNKFLLINDEGQFQLDDLNGQQQHQPDCKFNIQIYIDDSLEERKGRAVMLYVNKDGKKMVACCSERHEVCPMVMEPLPEIKETSHKALFYLTKLSTSNYYMFESSLYPLNFLGFEPDGNNPSLNKLVLFNKSKEEVVDACKFSLHTV